MRYFRNRQEITKDQAFDYIRATAKYKFNADYDDSMISGMFRNSKINSIGCIDPVNDERFTVYSLADNVPFPEPCVQGRLF